jgi:hypothetical protein
VPIVTVEASTFRDRCVGVCVPFGVGEHTGVAALAELASLGAKTLVGFSGVGEVAGQAVLTSKPVVNDREGLLLQHPLVAVRAEIATLGAKKVRLVPSVHRMAATTVAILEGHVLEDIGPIGMSAVMTFGAQCGLGCPQEIRLGGGMRRVAVRAPLGAQCRVLHGRRLLQRVDFGVAPKAGVIRVGLQKMSEIGSVWIMTLSASLLGEGGVLRCDALGGFEIGVTVST